MTVSQFDVFLSHNSSDKPTVRRLAKALQDRNLKVWLDEEQLVPGRPWQEALEEFIQTAKTAAVLVGKAGCNDGMKLYLPDGPGPTATNQKRRMETLPSEAARNRPRSWRVRGRIGPSPTAFRSAIRNGAMPNGVSLLRDRLHQAYGTIPNRCAWAETAALALVFAIISVPLGLGTGLLEFGWSNEPQSLLLTFTVVSYPDSDGRTVTSATSQSVIFGERSQSSKNWLQLRPVNSSSSR